jgi:hypothetical protein
MTDSNLTSEIRLGHGEVLLRDKVWEVVVDKWNPAEYDVGIMSDYPDSWDLVDSDGNHWDWKASQLTEDEDKAVTAALHTLDPPGYDYD